MNRVPKVSYAHFFKPIRLAIVHRATHVASSFAPASDRSLLPDSQKT